MFWKSYIKKQHVIHVINKEIESLCEKQLEILNIDCSVMKKHNINTEENIKDYLNYLSGSRNALLELSKQFK